MKFSDSLLDLKKIRMDLHELAELGLCEFETKEYILNVLKKYSCKIYEIDPTALFVYFDFGKVQFV